MNARIAGALFIAALLGSACAKSSSSATAELPADEAAPASSRSSSRSSGSRCSGTGPSVSLSVRGRPGGEDLSRDELGGLLGWIGEFARPCLAEPSRAPHVTMLFELPADGGAPTFELVERASQPELVACLDQGFAANAAAAPPGPMRVSLVVPWGCPTLGAGFGATSEPPAAAPAEPEPASGSGSGSGSDSARAER